MPAASRENLLRFASRVAELGQNESRLQAELAAVRAELDQLEAMVEPYLIHLERSRGANPPPSSGEAPREVLSLPVRPAPAITADDIREKALRILEEEVHGLKAIQIAKLILPSYNSENDNRAFENRVYTILKRDDRFAKSRRGHWVLAAYSDLLEMAGDAVAGGDDGDDGDAVRDARGGTLVVN